VIIIGAWPSGSNAAFILANRGFKVFVIDKHKFARKKLLAKNQVIIIFSFLEMPAALPIL